MCASQNAAANTGVKEDNNRKVRCTSRCRIRPPLALRAAARTAQASAAAGPPRCPGGGPSIPRCCRPTRTPPATSTRFRKIRRMDPVRGWVDGVWIEEGSARSPLHRSSPMRNRVCACIGVIVICRLVPGGHERGEIRHNFGNKIVRCKHKRPLWVHRFDATTRLLLFLLPLLPRVRPS